MMHLSFSLFRIFSLLIFSVWALPLVSQPSTDPDGISGGYFTQLHWADSTLVFSHSYGTNLYTLSWEGILSKRFTGPGCGRLLTKDPQGPTIGFKWIDSLGRQAPARLDPISGHSRKIAPAACLCGQPSFFGSAGVAYTRDSNLIIQDGQKELSLPLGFYTNLVASSPDGKFVALADPNQHLLILEPERDFRTNPNPELTCVYMDWNPVQPLLAFSGTDGSLHLLFPASGQTLNLGIGGNFQWSPNGRFLVFSRPEKTPDQWIQSDLFVFDTREKTTHQLSFTPTSFEVFPSFMNDSVLAFTYREKREIVMAHFSHKTMKLGHLSLHFSHPKPLTIAFPDTRNLSQGRNLIDLGEIPYVNQVYDTPDFHDGHGSCAPATALMALAWMNRLPPWPTEVSTPFIHTSDFGSYVADRYRFNETYFDQYTNPYGTDSWGAYSYMWTGGSPNSRMKPYFQQHFCQSQQYWTSSCTFEKTRLEIDDGFPHSICSFMTSSGHLTLAKGYIAENKILVFHDPYGNRNIGYPSFDGKDSYYDWPGFNNGYQNLDPDGTHGGVAWTVSARSFQPGYSDTLIDDTHYNHGFYLFNQPPSHQRFFRDQNAGFQDHFWYTLSVDSTDICFVTWTPNLPDSAVYVVSAFIPDEFANTMEARYRVHHALGDTLIRINQSAFHNQWVVLGSFPFREGQEGTVYLGDNTGLDGEWIAFDAILFSRGDSAVQQNYQPENLVEISLWPNPAGEFLFLQSPSFGPKESLIQILDPSGKKHYSGQHRNSSSSTLSIPVQPLASGLYFIEIRNPDIHVWKKFIKK